MKTGEHRVRIVKKWPSWPIVQKARKCLVRNDGYINAPLRRDLEGREGTGRGWGADIEPLKVPERP